MHTSSAFPIVSKVNNIISQRVLDSERFRLLLKLLPQYNPIVYRIFVYPLLLPEQDCIVTERSTWLVSP